MPEVGLSCFMWVCPSWVGLSCPKWVCLVLSGSAQSKMGLSCPKWVCPVLSGLLFFLSGSVVSAVGLPSVFDDINLHILLILNANTVHGD